MWERFRSFRSRPEHATRLTAIENLPTTATTANDVVATFSDFNLAAPSRNPDTGNMDMNPNTILPSRFRNNGIAALAAAGTVIGKNVFRLVTGASVPVVSGISAGVLSGARSGLELWRGGNANTLHARLEKKRSDLMTHRPEIAIMERMILGIRWNQDRENALTPIAATATAQEQINYVRDNLRYLIALDTTQNLGALNRTRNGVDDGNLTTLRNNVDTAWNGLNDTAKRVVVEQILTSQRRRAVAAVGVNAVFAGLKAAAFAELFMFAGDKIGNAAHDLTDKIGGWWKGLPFNQGPQLSGDHHVNLQPGMESINNGHVVTRPSLDHYSVKGYSEGIMKQDIIQYDLQNHANEGKTFLNHLVSNGELTQAQINSDHLLNSDGSIDYKNFRFSPHSTYNLKLANDAIHHMTDAYGNPLSEQLDNSIYNNGVANLRAQIEMRNPSTLFGNVKGLNVDLLNATRPGAENITYMAPFVQDSAKGTIDSLYQFSQMQPASFLASMREFVSQNWVNLRTPDQNALRKILLKAGYYANQFDWSKLTQSELNFLQGLNFVVANTQPKVA